MSTNITSNPIHDHSLIECGPIWNKGIVFDDVKNVFDRYIFILNTIRFNIVEIAIQFMTISFNNLIYIYK